MFLKFEQELEIGAGREGDRGRPCQMHPQEAPGDGEEGSDPAHLRQHPRQQEDQRRTTSKIGESGLIMEEVQNELRRDVFRDRGALIGAM